MGGEPMCNENIFSYTYGSFRSKKESRLKSVCGVDIHTNNFLQDPKPNQKLI